MTATVVHAGEVGRANDRQEAVRNMAAYMLSEFSQHLGPGGTPGAIAMSPGEARMALDHPWIALGVGVFMAVTGGVGRRVIGGGVRQLTGSAMTEADALSLGERWLGGGYRELGTPGTGVFRSADGLRQFRMTARDLSGHGLSIGPHVHFEAFDSLGEALWNLHRPIHP